MESIKDTDCSVDQLYTLINRSKCHTCGKCVFGYEGASQLKMIFSDIVAKKARPEDFELISDLSDMMKDHSMCEDGEILAKEVIYSLNNFKEDLEDHISKKSCRAGVCKKFMTYHILIDKCIGCEECIDACDEDAILGKKRFVHVIDQDECIQCGKCMEVCEQEAIVRAGANKPRCPKMPIPCRV